MFIWVYRWWSENMLMPEYRRLSMKWKDLYSMKIFNYILFWSFTINAPYLHNYSRKYINHLQLIHVTQAVRVKIMTLQQKQWHDFYGIEIYICSHARRQLLKLYKGIEIKLEINNLFWFVDLSSWLNITTITKLYILYYKD